MSESANKGNHSVNYRRLPHILFVGEGTKARTIMAEHYLKKMGAGLVETQSAGLERSPIDPRTVKVMAEDGFEVRDSPSQVASRDIMEWADIIIVLCAIPGKVHPWIPDGAIRKDWPIENPERSAEDKDDIESYIKVRDNIKRRVQQFVNAIKLSQR
jgi:arsenate reductase